MESSLPEVLTPSYIETTITRLKEWVLDYYPLIIAAVVMLVLGTLAIKLILRIVKKALNRSKIEPTTHRFFLSTIKILLYTLLFVFCAAILRVPILPLTASLGAVGLALSLAVKDSLSNVTSGIMLLYNRPFKQGDYVTIGGNSGTVSEIGFTYTKLKTPDNKVVFIPNLKVSSTEIINYSAQDKRRLDLTFSIGYKDDVELAKKLISEIVQDNPFALSDPEPIIRMCSHNESSLGICCYVWVKVDNYWTLNYDLHEQVKIAFDKNGISIPFPQLEVQVKE